MQSVVLTPILRSGLDYWNLKRGDRPMPARRDIDPTEIPSLLPHVQLIDILGERIRYRLIGTALVEAYGQDWTGKFADESFTGERLRFIEEGYTRVRHECRPMIMRNLYPSKTADYRETLRIAMPLSEDGSTVSQLFGIVTIGFPKASPPDLLMRGQQPGQGLGTIEPVDLAAP